MNSDERIVVALVFLMMIFLFALIGSVASPEVTATPTTSITIETEPTTIPTPTEPVTEPTEPEPTEPPEPEITYTTIDVPEKYIKRSAFKSYESFRAITSVNTPHYKLQNQYAYTAPDGIRAVNGRYCIALGSYFTSRIGQYVDIVLQNGTIIECILGDQKSDAHTEWPHVAHPDGSVVEFIIDKKVLPSSIVHSSGNVSDLYEEWQSPVVQIIVYDQNFFDEVS
jgi:hypothetical protein